MDNGQPPDSKRQRLQEHPQLWAREHPPLPPPPPDRDGFARPELRLPHLSQSPGPPRSFASSVQSFEPHRRHSDHTQYEPDPIRPSSQPHSYNRPAYQTQHNQAYGGGSREAMVKRSPSDESSQFRHAPMRNGVEPQERPPIPPYDGLPQHTNVQYRQPPPPSYLPQTSPSSPMPPPDPYNAGYSPHSIPGPQPQYGNVSYPSAVSNNVKKKAQRAAQACDSCRQLKAKCDEGRPSCISCKDKGINCTYRDPPPKQQDKTTGDILDTMNEVRNLMVNLTNGMNSKFDNLNSRFNKLEHQFDHEIQRQSRQLPREYFKQEQADTSQIFTPLVSVSERPLLPPSDPSQSTSSEKSLQNIISQDPYISTLGHELQDPGPEPRQDSETEEEEGGESVTIETKPSIPLNHTTGAAKLLLVIPIHELAREVISSRRGEKYPMLEEEKRGLLRLYGRGEGIDRPPGYERDVLIDHGAEGTPSESSGPDAPSPPGEEWGQLGGLTPPGDDSNIRQHIPRGSVIGPEGMPDMQRDTVRRLVASYNKHINNMHPILIPALLNKLVDSFLRSIPESHAKSRQISTFTSRYGDRGPMAGFVGSHPDSPDHKRKRSPIFAPEQAVELQYIYEFKPGHPFRSISTALVLMVMALGAICEHRGKIPYLASDEPPSDQGTDSPIVRTSYRSPTQQSPIFPTPTAIPGSPDVNASYSRSRRPSLDGGQYMPRHREKLKNIDVIPGLSYFALASDIIGNQLGGNSLQHVHVNILAGLYHGQLGRVLESHAYIFNACRSLEVILKPKIARYKKYVDTETVVPGRDNPLLIAFWTCLQLESDIIAELDVIRSGILKYEQLVPMPNLEWAVKSDGIEDNVMKHYISQLFLRKHLNQLHGMFYNPAGSSDSVDPQETEFRTLKAMEDNLNAIRGNKWSDDDEPASDILNARLRAKFYGARVISYRTYITQILERANERPGDIFDHYKDGIKDIPLLPENAEKLADLPPAYIKFAKQGISALIHSTTAFHGLGDAGQVRLIVTNIWGTTHAQFGNVLTLLACYHNPILKGLINATQLRDIVDKTIRFIFFNAQPRSALLTDYLILQNAVRKTNLNKPLEKRSPASFMHTDRFLNPSSSFGSGNSNGDTPMIDR
ncbi:hypothetical protein BJ878DRAFT_477472 [Calycina marina]|uniref:Zn(2)-C6 fungal-type domain-containing protein n=1 Tax=Calycina marina TaxID=1763456 RepID=A0A9P8CHJ5_9HELO|nr:hypothetical protein BJ878DRAFT_477472 [Calycina marina]